MVESDAITWEAPDWEHPARHAAQMSNATVARGDKADWLALFAPDALIEDPVGPSFLDPEGKGHRGAEEISRFWDSYVGMIRGFHFHVIDSFANGPACANVTAITTTLADQTTMKIECVLIYTVDRSGLIKSLRAHWEPERALATITKPSSR
ncbi:MAG: nuclear transport factor 2 family protein [Acidimicrobiales bacterium]